MAGSGRLTTTFERGVTSARPQVNTPFVDIAQGLRPIGQMVGGMIDDAREREMVKSGTAEGRAAANTQIAGGQRDMHFSLLDEVFAPARVDAAQKAYVATIKTDIDSQEEALRTKFALDPEGYKTATQRMVSGFIQGSPHDMAIDVAAYARGRVSDGLGGITRATVEKQTAESIQAIDARWGSDRAGLLSLSGESFGTKQWEQKFADWEAGAQARMNNPLFNYTPEQYAVDRDTLLDEVQLENVNYQSIEVYEEAGGGLKGQAAAMSFLSKSFGLRDPDLERKRPTGSVTFQAPLDLPAGSPYGAKRPDGSHTGLDIPAPIGTPVRPMAGGEVVKVGEDAKSGKFIRVLHDDGTVTAYAHLSAQDVKRGDRIDATTIIGKVGNTGNSTGPHLHVRAERGGKTVDPSKLYGASAAAPALAGEAPAPAEEPVVENALLAGLAPDRRRKLFDKARANLRQVASADMAEFRAQEQERTEQNRASAALMSSYQLAIYIGEDDGSWRNNPDLTDAQKFTLERTATTRANAVLAQEKRDEQGVRTATAATQARYVKFAENGLLTPQMIRDGIEAGEITEKDAYDFRRLQDKALNYSYTKEVLPGAGDYFKKKPPGMDSKVFAGREAEFRRASLDWLVANPDATPERRRQAGANILAALTKKSAPTQAGAAAGGKPAAVDRQKAARLAEVDRKFAAGQISKEQHRKDRKQILDNQ